VKNSPISNYSRPNATRVFKPWVAQHIDTVSSRFHKKKAYLVFVFSFPFFVQKATFLTGVFLQKKTTIHCSNRAITMSRRPSSSNENLYAVRPHPVDCNRGGEKMYQELTGCRVYRGRPGIPNNVTRLTDDGVPLAHNINIAVLFKL